MYCAQCGKQIDDGSAFCQHCGAKVNGAGSASSTRPMPPVEDAAPDSAFEPSPGPRVAPQQTPQAQASQGGAASNGLGIAGFVCALLGLVLCWVPVLSWILWIVGVVFSLIGLTKRPKGLAIAGTVISFIDVILIIVLVVGGCTAMSIGGCAANTASQFASSSSSSSSSGSSSSSSGPSGSSSQARPSDADVVTLTVYAANGERLSGTVSRDADGYVLPDSSTREYSMDEIENMKLTPAELCIAWNEPYARLGYHFSNRDIQRYFEGTSWYRDRDIQPELTGVAAANNQKLRARADYVGDAAKWKNLATD